MNARNAAIAVLVTIGLSVHACTTPETTDSLGADDIIGAVSNGTQQAEFIEGSFPTGELEPPILFTPTRLIQGKKFPTSVTLPEDATELYISVENVESTYLGVSFEEKSNAEPPGYYQLATEYMSVPADIDDTEMGNAFLDGYGYVTYLLDLDLLEGVDYDSVDLVFSYRTPTGVSRIARTTPNVLSLMPYQLELAVGFDERTGRSYSLVIEAPGSKEIHCDYDASTGNLQFDNTDIPESKLSFNSTFGVHWVELPPEFGPYKVTSYFNLDSGGSDVEYAEMLFVLNVAGKIEHVTPYVDINTNTYTATAGVSFDYLSELQEATIELWPFRPQNHYLDKYNVSTFDHSCKDTDDDCLDGLTVFKKSKIEPEEYLESGVGIRQSTNKNSTYYNDSDKNLLRTIVQIHLPESQADSVLHLVNEDANLNIFSDKYKSEQLLGGGANKELILSSNSYYKELWIEWNPVEGLSESTLEFHLVNNQGDLVASKSLTYRPFKTVILCFRGEGWGEKDYDAEYSFVQNLSVFLNNPNMATFGVPDREQGVFRLADKFYFQGYDSRKLSENDFEIA